jgi:hypothetical protein
MSLDMPCSASASWNSERLASALHSDWWVFVAHRRG